MTTKVCTKCKVEKNMSEFSVDRQKLSGLSSKCKTCNKKICSEQYQTKTEGLVKRSICRGGLSQNDRAAYAKLYRKENPEKVAVYQKKHRQDPKNIPKLRVRGMLRYTKQKQQTPFVLSPAHKAEMEGMYLFCQMFKGFQVDHIVPICGKQVSGLHVPWNLQILTAEENRAKGNIFNPDRYQNQGIVAY